MRQNKNVAETKMLLEKYSGLEYPKLLKKVKKLSLSERVLMIYIETGSIRSMAKALKSPPMTVWLWITRSRGFIKSKL